MTVQNIARTAVMTAQRDQTTGNLATVMKEEDVGSVVVVEDRHPIGIVTDRDLTLHVVEPRADPADVTAEEVMTETPVTVHTDAGIFEATAAMFEHAVRRLPIVDGEGNLTGIVTLDDLVVLLTDELDNLAGVIEAESPPY